MESIPLFPDHTGVLLLLGLSSGVLSSFAYLPYIRDTLNGSTQPQRASWLIWSALGSLSLGSQIYAAAIHLIYCQRWRYLFQRKRPPLSNIPIHTRHFLVLCYPHDLLVISPVFLCACVVSRNSAQPSFIHYRVL